MIIWKLESFGKHVPKAARVQWVVACVCMTERFGGTYVKRGRESFFHSRTTGILYYRENVSWKKSVHQALLRCTCKIFIPSRRHNRWDFRRERRAGKKRFAFKSRFHFLQLQGDIYWLIPSLLAYNRSDVWTERWEDIQGWSSAQRRNSHCLTSGVGRSNPTGNPDENDWVYYETSRLLLCNLYEEARWSIVTRMPCRGSGAPLLSVWVSARCWLRKPHRADVQKERWADIKSYSEPVRNGVDSCFPNQPAHIKTIYNPGPRLLWLYRKAFAHIAEKRCLLSLQCMLAHL